ncbi:BH0509 family protein [Metabacillus schmidteae]|nr:BH0509 family protein [Metabacillus schmidteae]
MMNRQERKNMIEFIERMKDIDKNSFLYMTDADIEHIYSSIYNDLIEHAE